jgi:hypothetical protein
MSHLTAPRSCRPALRCSSRIARLQQATCSGARASGRRSNNDNNAPHSQQPAGTSRAISAAFRGYGRRAAGEANSADAEIQQQLRVDILEIRDVT